VDTDLGAVAIKKRGLSKAPVSLPECVDNIVTMMDEATRESHGGRFWNSVDGKQIPW